MEEERKGEESQVAIGVEGTGEEEPTHHPTAEDVDGVEEDEMEEDMEEDKMEGGEVEEDKVDEDKTEEGTCKEEEVDSMEEHGN